MDLDQSKLKSIFDYSPETGVITWREDRKCSKAKAGMAAGCKLRGYIRIRLGKKTFPAHRLAWLYFYGSWPVNQIDHINGARDDNRIANLRDVDGFINAQNKSKPRAGNRTGLIGASFVNQCKGKPYVSTIRAYGKVHYLGSFETAEQAHKCYLENKNILHKSAVNFK